jgi:glutamyl-tRNA(Gln) amidotransferase subunit D
LLKKKGIKVGNKVKVVKDNTTYEGILMPRIETGDPNSLIVKLDNGYNVGLEFDEKVEIEKLGEGPELGVVPELKIKREKE